jgi:hypothetical protein
LASSFLFILPSSSFDFFDFAVKFLLHSSFLTPHSPFLTPHFSLLIPHFSLLIALIV